MIDATSIITLPLKKNIPDPVNKDWMLVRCPQCGRNCWESDLARKVKAVFPEIEAYCTECALTHTSGRGA